MAIFFIAFFIEEKVCNFGEKGVLWFGYFNTIFQFFFHKGTAFSLASNLVAIFYPHLWSAVPQLVVLDWGSKGC